MTLKSSLAEVWLWETGFCCRSSRHFLLFSTFFLQKWRGRFSASMGTYSQPPPSSASCKAPPFLSLGAMPRLCETGSSSCSIPAPWLLLHKAIASICRVQVPPHSTCVSWAAGGGRPSVRCMHFVIRHWRDEVRILPALSRVQILPTATRTTDTQDMDFSLLTKVLRIFNNEV